MVSFEIFVKAMPPSLSELKVLPSFCFAFKIPDDVAAPNNYVRAGLWAYLFHLGCEVFTRVQNKIDQIEFGTKTKNLCIDI